MRIIIIFLYDTYKKVFRIKKNRSKEVLKKKYYNGILKKSSKKNSLKYDTLRELLS